MTPKHFLKYSGKAKGEKIIAYEQCDQSSQTLGRLASTGSLGRSQPFRHGRSLSASSLHMSSFSHREECDLVILCLPMNRVVSRFDITPLLELTEVKKDWSNAFIALTFADSLQLKTADEQFTIKLEKKVKKFKKVLQKEYTLSAHTPPHQLKIFPTAYSPDTCLPNGHEWFTSLWAAILEFASTSGQLLHMTLSGGSDRRCVLYLNEATHLDELSLQPGDIITDIQWYKEGVWALGKCQGQTGLFHPLLLQRKHPIFEELKSKEKQESRPAPLGFSYEYQQQHYMFKNKLRTDNYHTCAICLQLASEPVLTECCGRSFCSRCIGKIKRQACPTCTKTPKTGFKYCRDSKTRRLIEDKVVFCPHYREGCNWEGELRNSKSHALNECRFEKIDCKRKCGIKLERRLQVTHDAHECPLREIACHFCYLVDGQDNMMTYQQMVTTHWKECTHWPVRCPNLCEDRYWTRGTLPSHLGKDCPKHVVPCMYKQFGCTFLARRQEMQEHEQESLQAHLNMVTHNYMQALKEIERLKTSLDALTATIETMQKKIADSTRECHVDP